VLDACLGKKKKYMLSHIVQLLKLDNARKISGIKIVSLYVLEELKNALLTAGIKLKPLLKWF